MPSSSARTWVRRRLFSLRISNLGKKSERKCYIHVLKSSKDGLNEYDVVWFSKCVSVVTTRTIHFGSFHVFKKNIWLFKCSNQIFKHTALCLLHSSVDTGLSHAVDTGTFYLISPDRSLKFHPIMQTGVSE